MLKEMVEKYNIGTTIPVLIFLDKEEKEVARIVGEKSYEEIEAVVASIEENE